VLVFGYEFPEWKPVSRAAGVGWIVYYLLFLLYPPANRSGFLVIDLEDSDLME
jgi:hypothetical protein